MLKNFRRVDGLQKYFNTKILQHSICNSIIGFRTAHGHRERQLPWKSFSKRIVLEATMYIKKYGGRRLESRCAKESLKTLPIDNA